MLVDVMLVDVMLVDVMLVDAEGSDPSAGNAVTTKSVDHLVRAERSAGVDRCGPDVRMHVEGTT
jgi:hypothetical protein